MKILLDTHVLLWLIAGDKRLSETAVKVFLDKNNTLFLSAISFWEICIKISLGKLKLHENWEQIINDELSFNNIQWLQIEKEHCIKLVTLPFHHRDPFDRMLIAQTMVEDTQLLSCDKKMSNYRISVIW